MHRLWRLADAAVLLLLFLFPMMILLGTAERTDRGPTLMFWLVLILPLLILPWLLRRADPDEGREACGQGGGESTSTGNEKFLPGAGWRVLPGWS